MVHDKILTALQSTRPRALKTRQLQRLVADLGLPDSGTWTDTLTQLIEAKVVRKVTLRAEAEGKSYRPITRYLLPDCTPLEIASSLGERTYLSHGTAVYLHGLTDLLPRHYYINREQSPKPPPKGPLTQEALDRAFRVKARCSRYTFALEGSRFTFLSGKSSKQFGVVKIEGPSGEPIRVTDLERTMVDIAVRPDYAGGLVEVLSAYETSIALCKPHKLLSTLHALGHKYPYHQSIGYLLERAGYPEATLQIFDALPKKVDFYLGHGFKETKVNARWRLHVPQAF